MMSKTKAAVIGALFLLAGPLAVAAASAPPDSSGVVERGDGQLGFIYWSDGYLAMVGAAEDSCLLPEPPVGPGGMTVSPANGNLIEFTRTDVPASVYEYPGPGGPDDPFGGFEFLAANCEALLDGDPTTEPIQPVATGEVRLWSKFRTDPDGITNLHNHLVGNVTTTGGDVARLSTFAQVVFTDGGATLIDLRQLTVRYSG